ncbi:hypothetical protein KBI23_07130 [bacterium]|nr:hypothetical protein [bacterium]MBP9809826.1 hypothetical protein [bacterium]
MPADRHQKTESTDVRSAGEGKFGQIEDDSAVDKGGNKPGQDLNLLSISGISISKDDAVKAGAIGTAAVLGVALFVGTRGKSGLASGAKAAEAAFADNLAGGLQTAKIFEGNVGSIVAQRGAVDVGSAVRFESGKVAGAYPRISDEAARAEIKQIKTVYAQERTAGKSVGERASGVVRDEQATGGVPRHPLSGELLSWPEHFKTAYIDALPTKPVVEFSTSGRLMPGKYPMDFDAFSRQFGQGERRGELLVEFQSTLQKLKAMGVKEVQVGGSFVSKKSVPGDIDFMFDKAAPGVNQALLKSAHDGLFSRSSAPALREKGLQMMVGPTDNATTKSLQYFLAHHNESLSGLVRNEVRPKRLAVPNGLVVLRL